MSSAHALGIGIQKQTDGNFRVSVINPNGWPKGKLYFDPQRSLGSDMPGVFKTVSLDDAASAMQHLLSGRMPPRPEEQSESEWAMPAWGRPLLAWLENMGPVGSRLSADFRGNGEPTISAPQKGGDCGVESLFAFMATALPSADYKRAKAACLNTMLQVADRPEVQGTAEPEPLPMKQAGPAPLSPDAPLPQARDRLRQRITTSLGGAMRAPPTEPPKTT